MRAALVCVALVTSLDAQAKCAMVEIAPTPLTGANATVGPTGGVVVGLTYKDRPYSATVEQKGWRFKQGTKLSTPTIKILAPSLAVYEFTGDSATLVDDKQRALVTVRRGNNEPAALTAPKLKSATARVDQQPTARWQNGSQLNLELAAAPPAGVIGVIVYGSSGAGGVRSPMTWAALEAKSLTLRFDAGGHCANDLPGTMVPTFGDITVAWFDGAGRVSPQSDALKIKSSN